MRTINAKRDESSDVAIIARILCNASGELTADLARHILNRGFSEADRRRMHDLAVRNQEDALSRSEKRELKAYAKAGTLLSILHSEARQVLGIKLKRPK